MSAFGRSLNGPRTRSHERAGQIAVVIMMNGDRTVAAVESLSSIVAHLALGPGLFPGVDETRRSRLPGFGSINKEAIAAE